MKRKKRKESTRQSHFRPWMNHPRAPCIVPVFRHTTVIKKKKRKSASPAIKCSRLSRRGCLSVAATSASANAFYYSEELSRAATSVKRSLAGDEQRQERQFTPMPGPRSSTFPYSTTSPSSCICFNSFLLFFVKRTCAVHLEE